MSAVPDFVSMLVPARTGETTFEGQVPRVGWSRIFGGLVVAQALAAAEQTVEGFAAHSLHAYFLLGGDPEFHVEYRVAMIRNGASFVSRHVEAIQKNRVIFAMQASFHRAENGLDHQVAMPEVPDPDQIPGPEELIRDVFPRLPVNIRNYFNRERPVEIRPVSFERYLNPESRPATGHFWIRAKHPLPDNPLIHRAVLAYASDMTLLDIAAGPSGLSVFSPRLSPASLDHALWFHRDFRADDWILFSQDSPTAANGRGFARGQFFTRSGVLIASVAQEGLLRIGRETSATA